MPPPYKKLAPRPEAIAPTSKYWESAEQPLPEKKPKQHLIKPRTIGTSGANEIAGQRPRGQRRGTQLRRESLQEPPRPVPHQPYHGPIETRPVPTTRTRSNRGTIITQPRTISGETQPYEGGSKRSTGMPKTEAGVLAQKHQYRKEAEAAFPGDEERQDAYVYGKMREAGWKPEHHSPWDGKTYKHWYWGVMKI